jgi:PAS domain S-box-containing protein
MRIKKSTTSESTYDHPVLRRLELLGELKLKLLGPDSLSRKLQFITDGIVEIFTADFARIWMIDQADLCDKGCVHAMVAEGPNVCINHARCLHLKASSGRYTHIDGDHRRVPFGCYKIGRVASGEDAKFITNDVTHDPRVHNHVWASSLGLVSFAGFRLLTSDGSPIGVLALFSKQAISPQDEHFLEDLGNTTSQVLLEGAAKEALKKSEERFRTLIENIPQKMFAKDKNLVFISCNENFLHELGKTREQIIGKTDFDFFPHDLAAKYQADDKRIIETGVTEEIVERHIMDGKKVWVQVIKAPIRDDAGEVIGILGIFWDITEHKQAEENAKLLMDDLKRSNTELEQFAHVASHDLQEPLRMVTSYTQLLAKRYRGKLGADADEYIAFAVEGTHRMQRLIDGLLEYSRMGKHGKPFAWVNLNDTIRHTLNNLEFTIEESNAIITVNNLPTVLADESQMLQLFQNLIGNAIKFRGVEAPRVHIDARKKDNHWLLSINDNGIGFESQFAERIFVIFQRLQNNSKYPGAGIGLAIAKKIIKRHEGQIWAESELGKGTTFYFTLPIHQ